MTVRSINPNFTDYDGYQLWRAKWAVLYKTISVNVRTKKYSTKQLQRIDDVLGSKSQKELCSERTIANKLMLLLDEAKQLWVNIKKVNYDREILQVTYQVEEDSQPISLV